MKTTVPSGLMLVAALLFPPAAAAAARPGVTTGAATAVSPQAATLTGKVNPRAQTTTYVFQYGTSRRYGQQTPAASAGSGATVVGASAAVGPLRPATTYHFRIVASNPTGVGSGTDRTFRTPKVPLSLSLAATPNPVPFGAPATLAGVLAGTGGGGRTVQLQQKAFPYTAGFVNTGNPLVTAPDGSFSTPVVGLAGNAQFRAVTASGQQLTSPAVLVGVAPVVRTAISTSRPRRGSLVRFAGSVTPSFLPAQVAVQKRNREGRWVVVAGTITRHYTDTKARYSRRVRVPRGGTYRVFVGLPDARYAGATGPEMKIRVR